MGRDLHDSFRIARAVFEEVDDALDERLSAVIFEGTEEELTLTRNAQPALMAVSVAVVRVLEAEGGITVGSGASFVAGHSLGEYSALAAAGCFSLADAARLLRLRGEAMQDAVPLGTGAMAALIGADIETARAIASEASALGVCVVANDNAPGQAVVSGATEAVKAAVAMAPEKGIKRAIMLPVSAPFHCPMMAPAAEVMGEAFAATQFDTPSVPVVANVTAQPTRDPEEIRALLVEQVTAMVRWREGVMAMRDAGVERLVEIGAGKVLTGLARRIDRSLDALAIGSVADLEKHLSTLGA